MAEKQMRHRVIDALKPLHGIPIENIVGVGTPDVNLSTGWMELKWMSRWPKNADKSPVLVPHFTNVQRLWLTKRGRVPGARCWLLWQVGSEWLLFDGPVAAKVVGLATRPELYAAALKRWPKGLINSELIECVS